MKVRTTGSLLVATLAVAMVIVLVVWRNVSVEVVYPVENALHGGSVTLREYWRVIRHSNAVVKENARLKREVAMLSLAQIDVERCEEENARLRRALDYVESSQWTWVAAEVISDGCGAFGVRKTLRVSKGSKSGIEVGAVVSCGDGLVGRVSEVTAHTSVVTLVTDESVQVGCEVEGTKMRAVTAGDRGNGMIALEHVRGGGQFPPRARVVTSGMGGVFPKGIEIGVLVDGAILPSVDFESLQDVYVKRKK